MVRINLLPWREELRQEKQRQFVSVLGLIAVLGALTMFLVYNIYGAKLDHQKARNERLNSYIFKLNAKIKEIEALEKERNELKKRIDTIQDLQKSRPQIVHVFDEIVTTIPEGVNLSSISRKADDLTLVGVAESGPRVSKFIRNLDTAEWIQMHVIDGINHDKNSGANRKTFVLQTKVTSPEEKKEDK
ncbi:MAG: PilN domain-containing protein [Gammaproteobacteria bacterium]|nr:PilN domain-containing protein [Gammaproteobacteria bacterium]MDH5628635.1 PilN domain-containing protein [Gammaproteobacteria bacterium]